MDNSKRLNFAELDSIFAQVANIVNQRPIGVKTVSEDDMHPITPNDLLLGRAHNKSPDVKYDTGETLTRRQEVMEELTDAWWESWYKQVFPSLVPYPKWAVKLREVRQGDVVLIYYDKKYTKGTYRLARVIKTHPGEDGVVRTVTVGYRQRNAREKVDKSSPNFMKNKPLTELRLGVQRLVVVLPMEEQEEGGKSQPEQPLQEGGDQVVHDDPVDDVHVGVLSLNPCAMEFVPGNLREQRGNLSWPVLPGEIMDVTEDDWYS